jgi:hypothetical protein
MVASAVPPGSQISLEGVETGRQLLCRVTVHLDADQDRRIARDKGLSQHLQRSALLRVIENEPIHHLDRRRPVRENRWCRRKTLEQIVELHGHHRLELRQRHEGDRGLDDDAERALRPDHQARHVEWRVLVDERIEVVAANASKHLGEAPLDLLGALPGRPPHLAIAHAFERRPLAPLVELCRVERPEMYDAAVG